MAKYLQQEDDKTQEFGFHSSLLWEYALVTYALCLPSIELTVSKRHSGDYSFFSLQENEGESTCEE